MLNATIQANLPPQVSGSSTSWVADIDTPADVWQHSFTVQVDDNYTGLLTTEIVVSTTQGAGETAVINTTSAWPATTPILFVSPDTITLSTYVGEVVPTQSIEIGNAGNGTLSWTAVDDANWLTLLPNSGTAPSAMQVSINAAPLAAGTYTANITVQSANATNGPLLIPVTLTVETPEAIQLQAESGYTSVMLNWSIPNAPDVVNYRLLLGDDGHNSSSWTPVATMAATTYFYQDDTLAPGETVCFRVEGLQASGRVLVESNVACAVYGETTLWIPDVSAVPGEIAIVPVNIRNAEGLQMAAADIWVEFDTTVLELVAVEETALTDGYIWSYSTSAVVGQPDFMQAHIGAFSNTPPTMFGDGSLFWLQFRVLGSPGDTSVLDLRDFISGIGGSTIYTPDDLLNSIPLQLEDGLLVVDGSFVLGDLNGNGVVETVDAYITLQIVVNRLTPTAEQLQAGDINGNGRIDMGDATMIFYRAIHGEWPSLHNQHSLQLESPANSSVTIRLDDVQGLSGDSVTTVLRAEELSDWAGGRFTIVYDTAVIASIQSVKLVGLADGFTLDYQDDEDGLLQIGLMNNAPISGSGALVEIQMQISENAPDGTSPLQLADAELNDLYGRDFTVSALQTSILRESGVITVSSMVEIYLPLIIRP